MFPFDSHDCSKELKSFNLKSTPARVAVLRFLEKSNQPVDVSMIRDYLREQDVDTDPATVFRIINAFTEKGITRTIQFGEGRARYELLAKGDHHHLICTNCGKITDVEDKYMEKLEKEIGKTKGFKVKSHSLEFFGLCRSCQN